MKVLVTRKTTSLDSLGEYVRRKVAEGSLSSEHLVRMKDGHNEHKNTFSELEKALTKHGIEYSEVFRGSYWPHTLKYEAVITVGGDGTVLDASHHIDNDKVPVIGIKSSGQSVGHLCTCDKNQIEKMVLELKNGTLKTMTVNRLKAEIYSVRANSKILTSPILNDALFCNTNPAATTRYNLTLGSKTHFNQSSGMWISTPAGSSAAMKAAGGEVMEITDNRFQYLIRELFLSPTSEEQIQKQGYFDPSKNSLMIESLCEEAALYLDGHYNIYKLSYGDTINFQAATPLRMVLKI